MPSRCPRRTFAAFRDTGIPLVQYTEAGRVTPAGYSDDLGIYLIVPRIAQWLHLPVTQALAVFLYAVAGLALVSGAVAWHFYSRDWVSRASGWAMMIGVTLVALIVGDTYLLLCAAVIGLVPPILVLTRDRRLDRRRLPWLLPLGVLAGAANLIRSQSGTAVAIFAVLVVMLLMRKVPVMHRLAAVSLLVAGMLVTSAAFATQLRARDAYLASRVESVLIDRAGHPLWHSVYIGFGFIQNPWIPQYLDEVASARVRAVDPTAPYLSVRYEEILRREVFAFVEQHPQFAAETVFAKTGVMLGYLLLCLNIGLPALVLGRPPLAVNASFAGALCFEGLFGLLVVPRVEYLLGFFAFAVLYAMVGVDSYMAARRAAAPRSA